MIASLCHFLGRPAELKTTAKANTTDRCVGRGGGSRGMKTFCFRMLALASVCAAASAQDRATVEAGERLYEEHCMGCHGERLRNAGTTFDLRKLRADDRSRFDQFVLAGKGQMPPWQGTLNATELAALWAYIRANAYDK